MTLFFTMLVPGILAAVAITGTVKRVDVYQGLADGAVDGMKILVRILPALVGLLTAVYMLRASGAMDALAAALAPVLSSGGTALSLHDTRRFTPEQVLGRSLVLHGRGAAGGRIACGVIRRA